MKNDTGVLHKMQDGIELFTVECTGESAVSIRGLSRMCGVTPKQIRQCIYGDGNGSKKLKVLEGIEVELDSIEIKKSGKKIVAISAKAAVLVIRHFDKLGNEKAQQSFDLFAAIGLESYIQGATGYLPDRYQESTLEARYQIGRILSEANAWERLFSAASCAKIRKWYFPKHFFWEFVYYWLTPEERTFLDENNPVLPGSWQRANRIFQHITEDARNRMEPEVEKLCTIVESCSSKQDFETHYNRLNGFDQGELFNA